MFKERHRQEPTQQAIARIVKCDQTTVGEWGRDALPRADLGIALAKAFNLTLDWLYLGRGPRNPESVVESQFAVAVEILARNWSDDERARTLQYLMEKDAFLKRHRGVDMADLIGEITADTGKHRKPS